MLTPDSESGRTLIIDGQQRLATTSLLLAAVRDIYSEWEEVEAATETEKAYLSWFDRRTKDHEPRLVLNAEDDSFFRELIVNDDAPAATRDSHERISEAYAILCDRLKRDVSEHGKRAEERLLAWADYLDTQALVITVSVPTEADAFVIFETLNDRGAPLTLGDLLKNHLFMRAGTRLDDVKSRWIAALAAMDLSAENDDFITFLRHHWSSKEGAIRERELYARIKRDVTSSARAVRYTKELAEAAKLYKAITEPGDDYWGTPEFGASASANVQTLLDLGLEQNRPLLLAVMQHFDAKSQKATLKALVSWSVRGLIVGGIGGGQTERAYCEAAVKVRAGQIKTTTALLSELGSIVPDDKDFEDAFSRARQTKPRVARYLQLALERSQRGEAEPELVPNDDVDAVNLEHILPRRPTDADWPDFAPEEIPQWTKG